VNKKNVKNFFTSMGNSFHILYAFGALAASILRRFILLSLSQSFTKLGAFGCRCDIFFQAVVIYMVLLLLPLSDECSRGCRHEVI